MPSTIELPDQPVTILQKIPKCNAVNKLHGYSDIAIYSPLEMIGYEDEDL